MPDPTDWGGTHVPVSSHRTLDSPWTQKRTHACMQRAAGSCCRRELLSFQERVKVGLALTGWLAWPLASQEDHLHLLLPWSWNQHQAQHSDGPRLLVPGGEGGAGRGGCGAGDRGLWSAVSPVCTAQCSGWWARERQSHSAMFLGGQLLGGHSDALSGLPATWPGFPPL